MAVIWALKAKYANMQLSGQGSNGEYLVHIAREPGALVSNSLKHFLHTTLVHTPFETASSRSFSAVSSAANRLNPTPRASHFPSLLFPRHFTLHHRKYGDGSTPSGDRMLQL